MIAPSGPCSTHPLGGVASLHARTLLPLLVIRVLLLPVRLTSLGFGGCVKGSRFSRTPDRSLALVFYVFVHTGKKITVFQPAQEVRPPRGSVLHVTQHSVSGGGVASVSLTGSNLEK